MQCAKLKSVVLLFCPHPRSSQIWCGCSSSIVFCPQPVHNPRTSEHPVHILTNPLHPVTHGRIGFDPVTAFAFASSALPPALLQEKCPVCTLDARIMSIHLSTSRSSTLPLHRAPPNDARLFHRLLALTCTSLHFHPPHRSVSCGRGLDCC